MEAREAPAGREQRTRVAGRRHLPGDVVELRGLSLTSPVGNLKSLPARSKIKLPT